MQRQEKTQEKRQVLFQCRGCPRIMDRTCPEGHHADSPYKLLEIRPGTLGKLGVESQDHPFDKRAAENEGSVFSISSSHLQISQSGTV